MRAATAVAQQRGRPLPEAGPANTAAESPTCRRPGPLLGPQHGAILRGNQSAW